MKNNDQLKAMKSIRKPMPKPTKIIKNKKKEILNKIKEKEIE